MAAAIDFSIVLPDGTRCTAATQPLVGALALPLANARETEIFPGPPAIVQYPG